MPLSDNTNSIIDNLIKALDIEINTIGNNPIQIKAKNGTFLNSTGNIFIYKFELDDTNEVPDDSNVEVLLGNQKIKATVISSHGLELMLSFEVDKGLTISQITIFISNRTALLLSQKQLIEEIKKKGVIKNETLVLKLFGIVKPTQDLLNNYFIPPLKFNLDTYQTTTIDNVTNSDISFIWGPPGTGKTIIISILTKIFIDCGLTVFITSNTNIAVDKAFEKLIELFQNTSADLKNGKVIRLGNIQIDGIKEFVQESAIIQRVAAPLFEKINLLNKELKPLSENKTRLKELIKDYLEYQKINKQFQKQSKQFVKIKADQFQFNRQLKNNESILLSIEQNISQLNYRLQISKNTNSFIRFVKRIKSSKALEKEINSQNYELNNYKIRNQNINNSLQSTLNTLKQFVPIYKKTEKEIELIKTKIPNIDGIVVPFIENEIKSISDNIQNLEKKIVGLNLQIEEIEKNLINEAKVIGTTLSMFHSKSKLYTRNYDVIIIDEVTMAIQPQIFLASCFANKKIIVVGDFNQLQPIIRTKNNNQVIEWLKKDIFRKNGIIDGTDQRLNTLRIQRRMKKAIAEISNQCLYNGILEHELLNSKLNNEPPVSFYDTSKAEPIATIPKKQGRINVYNAVLSVKLAQKYSLFTEINTIGIISPYRQQANQILKVS